MTKATSELNKVLNGFYDRKMLESAMRPNPFLARVKWRKVRVTRYFTIKLPVIDRVVDEGGNVGYRIILQEFDLFRIGTKLDYQPYYPKTKKGTAIKFTRYSDVNVINEKLPQKGK